MDAVSEVRLDIRDRIAELRIDNTAKLNALTADMLGQLERHLETVDGRAEIACLLVSGEGKRAFCAGADIDSWGDLPAAGFARRWILEGHRIFDRLARLSKPTVAVLDGLTLGGGLNWRRPATCASWPETPRSLFRRQRWALCRVGQEHSAWPGCFPNPC